MLSTICFQKSERHEDELGEPVGDDATRVACETGLHRERTEAVTVGLVEGIRGDGANVVARAIHKGAHAATAAIFETILEPALHLVGEAVVDGFFIADLYLPLPHEFPHPFGNELPAVARGRKVSCRL